MEKEERSKSKDDFCIKDLNELVALWSKTYNLEGKQDWSHILPYYHE